ncbi:hypothetical protein TNCV_2321481 [Trichonephila clavipes]|nr:hypothetical protein TNCV_2321481 [Trichonephila clavipes]
MFVNNPFGHKCDCPWFLHSLKPTKEKHLLLLNNTFPEVLVADFKLCATYENSLDFDKAPMLSHSNGFVYPHKQHGLPALHPISASLEDHHHCHSCRYVSCITMAAMVSLDKSLMYS